MNSHRSSKHTLSFYLLYPVIAITLLCSSSALAQPQIEWELVNPFPFITNDEKILELLKTFRAIPGERTALALEQELQRIHEERVDQRRNLEYTDCINTGEASKSKHNCELKKKLPYLGWFADLSTNSYKSNTCWDSSSLTFISTDKCLGYPQIPPTRTIRAWVQGISNLNPASGIWTRNTLQLPQDSYMKCPPEYAGVPCIEFEQTPEVDFTLIFDHPDLGRLETGPIRSSEKLVVGIGDSFASGEGNPDRPAQFMLNQSDRDFFWFWKWRRLPRRDLFDPDNHGKPANVEWLDRRCHRSMYSYQFKTALHMALINPKQAVTFVSYACSGATTDNIHLKNNEQSAQEQMLDTDINRAKKIKLQLKAVKEAIGDRQIDVLLLSTGGNDLKFSKYVADIVLSGKTRWLAHRVGQTKKTRVATFETKYEPMLKKNYSSLHQAIFEEYSLNISGCKKGSPCDRIVLMAYPNILMNEDGKVCKVDRDEFTMPFNRDRRRGIRTEKIYNDLFIPLIRFQQKAGDLLREDGSKLGWSIAKDTENVFNHHGFCSSQGPNTNQNDRMIMPQRKKYEWNAFRPKGNAEFALGKYMPYDYKPYGSRARWVRLPLDSKLVSDQREKLWRFTIDFLFKDDRSSVMHPTAMGHAAMADMNLRKLREILGPAFNK